MDRKPGLERQGGLACPCATGARELTEAVMGKRFPWSHGKPPETHFSQAQGSSSVGLTGKLWVLLGGEEFKRERVGGPEDDVQNDM